MSIDKLRSIIKVKLRQVRDGRVKFRVDKITRPAEVYDAVRSWYKGLDREALGVLALDSQNQPVAYQIVSIGTATASLVHPREVFQAAIAIGACALIIAHNHPSGDPSPSREDRDVTQRLASAGKLLGIKLLDALVVTDSGYQSTRETEPQLLAS